MTKALLFLLTTWSLATIQSRAEDPKEKNDSKDLAVVAVKEPLSAEQLEAKFRAMLTKATLSGRWAPVKDGVLGPEKEDKYGIVSIGKVSGDSWVVNAKMKYNGREFIAPLPVQVKWAGDTPVMIVDKLTIPGGKNSYSARVLFFEQTYAGTWSGGDHGGLLSGIISNEKEERSGDQSK